MPAEQAVDRRCVGCGQTTHSEPGGLVALSCGRVHLMCAQCVSKEPSSEQALRALSFLARLAMKLQNK
ncbi:MAG: hypothetical protein QM765_20000 [Myxococcales bacterium]